VHPLAEVGLHTKGLVGMVEAVLLGEDVNPDPQHIQRGICHMVRFTCAREANTLCDPHFTDTSVLIFQISRLFV
jgi:hypothetical protein